MTQCFHRSNLLYWRIWERLLRPVNFFVPIKSLSRNDVKAFTLAEVLITLTIIAVVAAMIIPALNNAVQDAQFKTAYKKAFADGNNAFKIAIANGESYSQLASAADGINACINWQIFSSQFKKMRECTSNNNPLCWNMTGETTNGGPANNAYGFLDSSGRAWSMRGNCEGTWDNTYFLVDTNGFEMPNRYGKDRWAFYMHPATATNLTPIKISVPSDYVEADTMYCQSGGCMYRSWLMGQ